MLLLVISMLSLQIQVFNLSVAGNKRTL